MRIAITGANSSVGKVLLRHIATQVDGDLEAYAGVRTRQAIATLPNALTITPHVIRYGDRSSLQTLLEGANCLVHLAGILIENKHSSYQTANIDATQAIVAACRHAAVDHIVLISALGADINSRNRYYRSKGVAEQIVAQSDVSATIIRTPILLGPATAGAQALVAMASRSSVRTLGGGHHSLCPLDVDDLNDAILHCCRKQADGVAIHELVGPTSLPYRDLIHMTGQLMGHNVSVGSIPVWAAKLGGAIAGLIRRGGMTPTVIEVITADETVQRKAVVDLGVNLTPLTATLKKLLRKTTLSQ